jgi:hypothetical protein
MDELLIEKCMKRDHVLKKMFLGVFARDEIPTLKLNDFPFCFIVNTHPRKKKEEHWLAFYVDKFGFCDFFDSYGISPDFYNLKEYLKFKLQRLEME